MSPRRHPARNAAIAALAAASLLSTPAAWAGPQHENALMAGRADAAAKVAGRLGAARTAGAYVDQATGRSVVTVTDAAAARTVRAAGATPRTVARSGAALAKVTTALGRTAHLTGTAWSVDPRSDTVTVLTDDSVTGARLARVRAVTRPFGAAVRLRRVSGRLAPKLSGGDEIDGSGVRCTAGVNVTNGSAYYVLTAGHCGQAVSDWTTPAGDFIGSTVSSSFPGNDFAIIGYTGSVPHPGTIGGQDVTSAGAATVGEHACMLGAVSGLVCGTIQGLNVTVNYAEGVVTGLIQTNICAQPGDSGAPLFDGPKVLGILSGASGNCASGGTSFFQPILEILSSYGVNVY